MLEATLDEQRRHGHTWIGTEHLLLGLLDAASPISGILRAAGADPDEARRTTVQVFTDARKMVRMIATSKWYVPN